jgi:glycosyltransferase involved in cell wall biosynthesis
MTTTIYYPTVGGGARYQKDVVDYFRKKGDIIDVLTISTDKNMYLDSNAQGSIVRLPKLGQINSAIISLPFSYLFGRLATGYDILHFNFPNGMAEIAALYYKKKLKHVKKVVFYHADIVPAKRFSGIYNKLVTSRFLKLMDQIIVSSILITMCHRKQISLVMTRFFQRFYLLVVYHGIKV